MITIDDIKGWSIPHPISKGSTSLSDAKISRFGDGRVMFSIVGGATGLYGDFEKTFEVAIIEQSKGIFVTRYFYEKSTEDVIGWMNVDDLLELVNSVLKKQNVIAPIPFPS